MLVNAPDREEAPPADEAAADLRKVLGTLTRGERAFCRSVAFRAVPMVAYRKAWPGWAARHGSKTIATNVAKLLERQPILSAIEHYRQQIGTAPKRLEWGKMQRAQDTYERHKRLGIGVRDVGSVVDHGTDQLRGKLKSDVIAKLRAMDPPRLLEYQVWAAKEIRSVIEAKQRGLFSGSRPLDGTHGIGGGAERTPLESMSAAEREAYEDHYEPWKRLVEVEIVSSPRRDFTALQITYAVVVNNYGPWQIEDRTGLRRGTVVPVLQDALRRYAVLAGWVNPPKERE